MAAETLSDFLKLLEREGELARISAEVDPKLEIAAICDRVCKMPAPHGHRELDRSPAANLGGKAAAVRKRPRIGHSRCHQHIRILLASESGVGNGDPRRLGGTGAALVKPEIPTTLMEKMKKLPDLLKLGSFPPKSVRSGICQQVVLEGENADLDRLPIIQCWPLDGDLDSGQALDPAACAAVTERGSGRYITLGGIFTQNPETGDRNIGMYRVQQFGPRKCAMHWHMHHDGARHFRMYQKKRRENAAGHRAGWGKRAALRGHRPAAAGD